MGRGDVSGSGSTAGGSGLSRWTLFRSWWKGNSGAIRLPDEDDDDEEGERQGFRDEEQDAVPISEGSPFLVQDTGEEDHVGRPPFPPAYSSLSTSTRSDSLPEPGELDQEERKARRRARRRARELGLSIEEFEGGVGANHHVATTTLENVSSPGGSGSPFDFVVLPESTGIKQLTNGSHGFDFNLAAGGKSTLQVEAGVEAEEEEGMDGGEELFGEPKRARSSSRRSRTSSSKGSHSGESSLRGSGSASRSQSQSQIGRNQLPSHLSYDHLSPSLVPLPSSPTTSSSSQPFSQESSSHRPRPHHRPPTTSSISSHNSSNRRSHRSKKHQSPLEDQPELSDGAGDETDFINSEEVQYRPDATGQLQPHQVPEAEQGQFFLDPETGHEFWVSNSQLQLQYSQQQVEQQLQSSSWAPSSSPRFDASPYPQSSYVAPDQFDSYANTSFSSSVTAMPARSVEDDQEDGVRRGKTVERWEGAGGSSTGGSRGMSAWGSPER